MSECNFADIRISGPCGIGKSVMALKIKAMLEYLGATVLLDNVDTETVGRGPSPTDLAAIKATVWTIHEKIEMPRVV